MPNTVIKVENLSKEYRLGKINHGMLYRDLQSWWAKIRKKEDPNSLISSNSSTPNGHFWALKDVSFEVKQGEVLGIIGRNGAGKSTLLKILSRVTTPTKGTVKIRGRVASLLEVGTGFHPELSGRENIYLNGTILGMTKKEIDKKFDEIVAFAEIEQFIDTPVKRYSSGMYVRLAFAIAAHLEPEILIVDEVLAVGDVDFQKKCLGKIGEVEKAGRNVIFVSHQMDMVRAICNLCILLNNGMVVANGRPEEITENYIKSLDYQKTTFYFKEIENTKIELQILAGSIVNKKGEPQGRFDVFDKIIIEFEYVIRKPRSGLVVNFELKRNETLLFLSFDTDTDIQKLYTRANGLYRCRVELPCPLLKPGRYFITTNTGIANSCTYQRLENILVFDVELYSRPSSVLSYVEKRPGFIAVPLHWETHMLRK